MSFLEDNRSHYSMAGLFFSALVFKCVMINTVSLVEIFYDIISDQRRLSAQRLVLRPFPGKGVVE